MKSAGGTQECKIVHISLKRFRWQDFVWWCICFCFWLSSDLVNPTQFRLCCRCCISVSVKAFLLSPVKGFLVRKGKHQKLHPSKWIRNLSGCSTTWTSFSLQFKIFSVAIAHDSFLAPLPHRWMACYAFSFYKSRSPRMITIVLQRIQTCRHT